MLINSVKLIDSGQKGIEVKYALPIDKDGRKFTDELTHKKKAPIHAELEETFGWLKGHLLDICGYGKENREEDLTTVEIVSVTFNDKGFILVGKKNVLEGDLSINLITPLITDGNVYSDFGKVCSILEGIYTETKEYMSGNKTFSDEQLVIKFSKNDEAFDEAGFKNLSKEEQRKIADSILVELKAIAFFPEEELVEEPASEIKEEVAAEIIEEKVTLEHKVKKEKGKIVQMVSTSDDEFSIVMANIPEKISTAKRI